MKNDTENKFDSSAPLLRAAIRTIRKEQEKSLQDISGLARMNVSTLSKIETNDPNYHPSRNAIQRILKTLGTTIEAVERLSRITGDVMVGLSAEVVEFLNEESFKNLESIGYIPEQTNAKVISRLRSGECTFGLVCGNNEYSDIEFIRMATIYDIVEVITLRSHKEVLKKNTSIRLFFLDLVTNISKHNPILPFANQLIFYPDWVL